VGDVISVLAAVGGFAGSSVEVGVVLVVVQAVKSMIRTIIEMKNLERDRICTAFLKGELINGKLNLDVDRIKLVPGFTSSLAYINRAFEEWVSIDSQEVPGFFAVSTQPK
jgi:hypothetical protein